MKPIYTLKAESLPEKSTLVDALLAAGEIISVKKIGSTWFIYLYERNATTKTEPVKDDFDFFKKKDSSKSPFEAKWDHLLDKNEALAALGSAAFADFFEAISPDKKDKK